MANVRPTGRLSNNEVLVREKFWFEVDDANEMGLTKYRIINFQ